MFLLEAIILHRRAELTRHNTVPTVALYFTPLDEVTERFIAASQGIIRQ
jgi:hypothetical protein